jgi:hypothetical protein
MMRLAQRCDLAGLVDEHLRVSDPVGANAHLTVPGIVAGMIVGAELGVSQRGRKQRVRPRRPVVAAVHSVGRSATRASRLPRAGSAVGGGQCGKSHDRLSMTYLPGVAHPLPMVLVWAGGQEGCRDAEAVGGTNHWPWQSRGHRARDGWATNTQLNQTREWTRVKYAGNAASHTTPVEGLYLCGSGTRPGGGVFGVPGRNAA